MTISFSVITAMAKGTVFITTPEDGEVKVECIFDYILDAQERVRISVHLSSAAHSSDRVSISEEQVIR